MEAQRGELVCLRQHNSWWLRAVQNCVTSQLESLGPCWGVGEEIRGGQLSSHKGQVSGHYQSRLDEMGCECGGRLYGKSWPWLGDL